MILIDQLKQIYSDAELEPIDTAQWYPKMQRKDYAVALNLTGTLVDDPDAMLYENYACGGVGNYNGYCNPEIDKLIEQQSMGDQEKRKWLVWEIERRLTEDDAKSLVDFNRGGICWDPSVKKLVNSIYNRWRMEDIWLDKEPRNGNSVHDKKSPKLIHPGRFDDSDFRDRSGARAKIRRHSTAPTF